MAWVILIGGGGHGRVLLDALLALGADVLGIADPALPTDVPGPRGLPVLGGDDAALAQAADAVMLVNGVGSTRSTAARTALYERFVAAGYRFATVVHPAAVIAGDVALGDGAQVMAGAVLQTGARLGANCIVNTRASVDHDCDIGAGAHIAPGVTLSGGVRIGPGSHIGTGAVVIQQVRIGAGALIGAGAVVLADVPDGGRVDAAGAPRGTRRAARRAAE
jgi:UDP-perosamine 4-acetyltransferase